LADPNNILLRTGQIEHLSTPDWRGRRALTPHLQPDQEFDAARQTFRLRDRASITVTVPLMRG